MSSTPLNDAPQLDLSLCAKEPVHTPGAIQPHGVLFVLDPGELTILGVSDNTQEILGRAPGEILGRAITSLTDPRDVANLVEMLGGQNLEERIPFRVRLEGGGSFGAIAHRHDKRLILEIEPEGQRTEAQPSSVYNRVRGSLVRLRRSSSLHDLCAQTAREIRQLTGFDRVLVYAFKPDWSGEAVAEDCEGGAPRYLGLRFPSSDIPSQARALYAECRLRTIPTSTYTPAVVVGLPDSRPLDLTHAALRSISPVHLEYMRNMGVSASMGISLMRDEQLWGLITCNHESGRRFVPNDVRTACALLGETVSSLIGEKEGIGLAEQRVSYLDTQAKIINGVVQDRDVARGLTRLGASLLDLTHSSGAAFFYKNELHCIGKTPPADAIIELVSWIDEQRDQLSVMDSLPRRYPPASDWREVACGMIAAPILFPDSTVVTPRNWLLWFRPEVVQTVAWGGDPSKPADHAGEGNDDARRLHPRKSFAQWKEDVHLESVPFEVAEVSAARSLAEALTEVILEIEAGRQIEENALLVEASNRRLVAQIAENHRVQLVLAARTEELRQRETSLQLVLDSTGEGLISVGLDGRLLAERSRAVEQWFGDLSRHEFIWDVLFEDAERSQEFRLAWEQLAADVLPFEVSVDQMCRELVRDRRSFELGYKEVRQALALSSILVTIEDVTERAEARLAAREAGEAQTILASVLSDARGFGRALAELSSLFMAARDSLALADARRALHTLKGNAALLGLMKLRESCHQVEDRLAERGASASLSAADLSGVDEELARVRARVRDLVGDMAFQRVEIPIGELTDAIEVIERGSEPAEVLGPLRRWTLEPVARHLSKLAARARGLARDLGKHVDVVVIDGDVRVDAARFEPLWGALAHAVSNAVDHGIEPEGVRLERGKGPSGQIVLSVKDAGPGWVAIDIADDGGGIDLESVRAAALRRGLPCTTRQDLLDALFADELSTKAEVSLTSGRGVGLAALRDTCALIGGSVDIDSLPGIGTTLHLRIPVLALQATAPPAPRVPPV